MRHECPHCAEKESWISVLEARVAELERALEGAVYAVDREASALTAELRVSPQQAQVILILWRSRTGHIDKQSIIDALPDPIGNGARHKSRERSPGFMSSVVRQIRTQLGQDFIENAQTMGYRLSPPAHQRVSRIIRGSA